MGAIVCAPSPWIRSSSSSPPSIPGAAGATVEGLTIAAEPKAFADAGAEVVVDFTVADSARRTVPWLAMHGIHAVVGTTGLTDDDLAAFGEEFGDGGPNCIVAANFSISAVLMMRFAEVAAPYFDTAEIIELHHDTEGRHAVGHGVGHRRQDGRRLGQLERRPDAQRGAPGGPRRPRPGGHPRALGAHPRHGRPPGGHPRCARSDPDDPPGQLQRESFMPGVILACKHVSEHDGLTIGLDALLNL